MGFMINKKWAQNVYKYWKVSERIAVIQLIRSNDKKQVNKSNIISIVNVYAPTTQRIKQDNTELHDMYNELGILLQELQKLSNIIFIAGDFNAKIGKSNVKNPSIGRFSRGRRNASGEELIDFCNIHNLFVSNSAFQHPARHITTWQTQIIKNDKTIMVYNQIDYILCKQNQKQTLIDARSFSNTLVDSDHRIVVTKLDIQMSKIFPNNNKEKISKPFNTNMFQDNDIKNEYKHKLKTEIVQVQKSNDSCNEKWKKACKAMIGVAKCTIGFKKSIDKHLDIYSQKVENLSNKQKELRQKIMNCQVTEKVRALKSERNKILHEIHQEVKKEQERELNRKMDEIDKLHGDTKIYKAVKMLNMKAYENPIINDESGKQISNLQEIHNTIKDHFQNHFNDKSHESIKTEPYVFNHKITEDEVKQNIMKLNNSRATGFDNISAEMIKYAPPELHSLITIVLNECIQNDTDIEIGFGLLNAIQKPNKPKGPVTNLRPLILLPSIRKILSNIVLNRIKSKVDKYLSAAQSAYRNSRSTGDIVWAYRWMIAKTQIVKETILVTGIDLSSAFDTIDRNKLIDILKDIVDEDELAMIKYLLKNTSLMINMKGVKATIFDTNIGSPQGDGISGVLFIVYFEHTLRKLRKSLNEQCTLNASAFINHSPPSETTYADDHDHITTHEIQHDNFNRIFSDILKKDNLKVNITKTEHTTIERGDNNTELWRNVKKLGSLLGDKEDIERRKQLAIAGMNKFEKIWIRNNKIREEIRIDLYKKFIVPILLYNCETWGMTKQDQEKLNTFHRKQLRRVIGKKYPDRISNNKLYERCKCSPITIDIAKRRWQKFGHILRLNENVPANEAMRYYFSYNTNQSFRGRPRYTIVTQLNDDVKLAKSLFPEMYEKYPFIRKHSNILLCNNDLQTLRLFARDRHAWNSLVKYIYCAVEADLSL